MKISNTDLDYGSLKLVGEKNPASQKQVEKHSRMPEFFFFFLKLKIGRKKCTREKIPGSQK